MFHEISLPRTENDINENSFFFHSVQSDEMGTRKSPYHIPLLHNNVSKAGLEGHKLSYRKESSFLQGRNYQHLDGDFVNEKKTVATPGWMQQSVDDINIESGRKRKDLMMGREGGIHDRIRNEEDRGYMQGQTTWLDEDNVNSETARKSHRSLFSIKRRYNEPLNQAENGYEMKRSKEKRTYINEAYVDDSFV